MKVIPLGIGGAISNPLLGNISLLINIDDENILIDAGEGTYRMLRICGFDIDDIDLILLTHRHSDHTAGLMTLLLFAARKNIKLKIYAPSDFDPYCYLKAFGNEKYIQYIDLHTIDYLSKPSTVLTSNKYVISAVSAEHSINALAFRIDDKQSGKCVTYSGDTKPTSRLIELAQGCTLLIHEVSRNTGFEDEAHADGHSTTLDALNIAINARVKFLMPIHYYINSPIIPNTKINIIIPIPCTPIDITALS